MEHYYGTALSLPSPFSIFPLIVSSILLWCFLFKSKGRSSTSLASRALLFRLLFARGFVHDIRSVLHRLRERYGPVITVGFGPMSVTWVMDRHIVHRALVQAGGLFPHRKQLNEGSIFFMICCQRRTVGGATGKLWGVLRRNLQSKALHSSNLRAFAGSRRLVAEQELAELRAQRQGFAVARIFERAFYQLTLLMCFGEHLDVAVVRSKAESNPVVPLGVKLCIFASVPYLTKFVFWRKWRKYLQRHRRAEEIIVAFLKARRERAAKEQRDEDAAVSYADTLLELEIPDGDQEGGGALRKLRDEEISSLCQEFMLLSVETTVCAAEWVMANLIVHPQVQQRLYEDIVGVAPPGREMEEDDLAKMPYLRAVILETLRLHPPVTIPIPRAATQQVCVHGHTIEKGRLVLFDLADVGRDEAIWEEPREFKPERFLEGGEGAGVDITGGREIKMAPFGVGRKMCPGIGVAMLNLEYFVACLVRGFSWEAAAGESIDMAARIDIVGAMKKPLRARASARQ